ncbi:DinB-like domain containing protein [Actinobacteria bacterium OK074]|nr:DinB-like domain containing protein [Actinobacteria bacterium OK074]
MRYADTTPAAAVRMIRSFPPRYRRAVEGLTDAGLRRRPDPRTWSALEYTCHVRDVYEVYGERLVRALTEERPALEPMRNERRARRMNYDQQALDDVLDALARRAAHFATLAESVGAEQWARTVTRLPGEERTVLWLVRQAAHEGLHHLHDITRITRTGTAMPRRDD